MDEKTEDFIKNHADRVVREFSFANQIKKNPNACPCYQMGKSCHDLVLDKEKHNCFLCYCPWYDNSKPEGGCKKGNLLGKGKWFYSEKLKSSENSEGKVWDCTDCSYPHQEKVVREFLEKMFSGELEKDF